MHPRLSCRPERKAFRPFDRNSVIHQRRRRNPGRRGRLCAWLFTAGLLLSSPCLLLAKQAESHFKRKLNDVANIAWDDVVVGKADVVGSGTNDQRELSTPECDRVKRIDEPLDPASECRVTEFETPVRVLESDGASVMFDVAFVWDDPADPNACNDTNRGAVDLVYVLVDVGAGQTCETWTNMTCDDVTESYTVPCQNGKAYVDLYVHDHIIFGTFFGTPIPDACDPPFGHHYCACAFKYEMDCAPCEAETSPPHPSTDTTLTATSSVQTTTPPPRATTTTPPPRATTTTSSSDCVPESLVKYLPPVSTDEVCHVTDFLTPITPIASDGETITFEVAFVWQDSYACNDTNRGAIDLVYVSIDDGNGQACDKWTNMTCEDVTEKYTVPCTNGMAHMDLYVHDHIIFSTMGGVSIPEVCGGDPDHEFCSCIFQYEIECDPCLTTAASPLSSTTLTATTSVQTTTPPPHATTTTSSSDCVPESLVKYLPPVSTDEVCHVTDFLTPITPIVSDGENITFEVAFVWQDSYACNDTNRGAIDLVYVSIDDGNGQACDKWTNMTCDDVTGKYTVPCRNGMAHVDLYVHDHIIFSTMGGVSIPDVCGGDPDHAFCSCIFQYEIECDPCLTTSSTTSAAAVTTTSVTTTTTSLQRQRAGSKPPVQQVSSQCPAPLVCCEEDCCGIGTSWIKHRGECFPDLVSEGFNGTHSEEYEVGCIYRQCCESECCGAGSEYDESSGYCLRVNDTKVLSAELFFPDVPRKFSDGEKTDVASAFRNAYNTVARSIGLGREVVSVALVEQVLVEILDRQGTKRRIRAQYSAVTRCSACEDGDSLLVEDSLNRLRRHRRWLFTSEEASALRALFITEYESLLAGLINGIPSLQVIIPLCTSDSDCPEDAPFCDNSVEGASWECTPRRGILDPVGRN